MVELVKTDLHGRWRAGGGAGPRLDDYAARFPALGRPADWPPALVAEEYCVRRLWGDRPDPAEYLTRFPARADELRAEFARVDDELAPSAPTAPRPGPAAGLTGTVADLFPPGRHAPDPLADDAATAAALVADGLLTRYQADEALAGRAAGLVVGPYVLLEPIGEGGGGRVFRATHRSLGRCVALKVLRSVGGRPPDPGVVSRFRREVRAVGRLSHPNVIAPLDAGVDGDVPYLATEYVGGTDLLRIVRGGGPLPPDRAADYAWQVAAGLRHLHDHDLVHRDIKPSNLLVTPGGGPWGEVKVIDLGLARSFGAAEETSVDGLTVEGSFLGTADYAAPEQAADARTADIRADLYSLGCTLYFLLTGTPPFPGGTLAQKLLRHAQEAPPDPRAKRPDTPDWLAAVVLKLLAKRPEKRYQTPAELAAALSGTPPAPRPGRRSRWRLVATAVAAAAGGVVWVAARPAAPPPDPPLAAPRPRGLLREFWLGVPGYTVQDVPVTAPPAGADILDRLETPLSWTEQTAEHLHGFLHPPATGRYRFCVCGDDSVALFLSPNADPGRKALVAWFHGATVKDEWDKYSTQTSQSVALDAGRDYYLEVLHKQSVGQQFFAVSWEGPGLAWQVIDGRYLSPWPNPPP